MKPPLFRAAASALALALALFASTAALEHVPRSTTLSSTLYLPVALTAPVIIDPNAGLVNGSFEEGWTDMPPVSGFLINQQPKGWVLSWVEIGDPLFDPRQPTDIAGGVAECLHKNINTLPPDEWPGAPNALILDGTHTYKTFHAGTSFGTELRQTISNMPGGRYRLTVPVNLHWQEKLDPSGNGWDHETAESAAFVIVDGVRLGRWANALEMGDRTWYTHTVEFEVSPGATIDVVLQFKSRYARKDFFIDKVELVRLDE